MRKRILIGIGIVFMSLALVIALIPTIISSSWAKAKIEALVNRSIKGYASFSNIHVSFFGPQSIENVVLKDPEDQFVLSIEELKVDHSLLSLIFKRLSPGNLHIHNLNLNLTEGENGDSNLRQALQSREELRRNFVSLGSPIYFHAESLHLSLDRDFFGLMTHGTTYQNDLEGLFTIDVALAGLNENNIQHLTESPELLMHPNTHFHVDATIKNLPVALIDLILAMKDPNLRGLAEQTLGSQLNFDVHNAKSEKNLALEINASSRNVHANFIVDLSQDRIAITKPGTMRISIAPSLFQHFLDPKFDIQLGRPTNLLFAIEHFILPIENNRYYNFGLAELKGRVDLQEAILKSRANFSDILLDKLSATFDTAADASQLALKITGQASQNGDPVQIAFETWIDKTKRFNVRMPPPVKVNLKHIPMALVDELLELDDLLEKEIGSYADLSIDTILQKDALDVAVEFVSEKVRIPSLLLHMNQDLSLIEPIKMEYKLPSRDFDSLHIPEQAIKLQAQLNPIKDFLSIQDFSQLNLSGMIAIDEVILSTDQLKENIRFKDIQMPWSILASENKMIGEMQSSIYLDQTMAGKISKAVTITNWLTQDKIDLNKAFLSAKVDLKEIPHQLIAAFSQEKELAKLIGPSLDLSLETNFSLEKQQGTLSLGFTGEGLEGSGRFKINYPVVVVTPFTVDFKLTPERFKAIRHLIKEDANDHLTLAEIAHLKLHVSGITEGSKVSLLANAHTDQLVVLDTISGTSMTFKEIQAEIQTKDLYDKLDFNLTAKQKSMGQTSDFLAKGIIENAFLPNGSFNKKQLTLLVDVKISELPLNLFCDTFCVNKGISQKLEALFGPTLNVDIHTALQESKGPVLATLNGPNGHVVLDARIDKGTLYLNLPFQAKFTATKALGHSILQDIFPLLSGTVSADQPFTISISDKGFAFPLFNFNPSLVQISSGTLSLGNVKFTKDGQLGEILTLLTPPNTDLISVWFTPLYFSMNQGELHLSRIDMLISNHFPVAAWGTLNFPKDRIQMVIGLSGDAISYAFDVNVDSAYMLQLPLKGKIASPSLDKSRATTKIGALVAHSQKSTQGTILGTVLDLASGGLTEEKPPRPTTNPFPWEKQTEADRQKRIQATPPPAPEEKKKSDKLDSGKIIEKAANSLLDSLLK